MSTLTPEIPLPTSPETPSAAAGDAFHAGRFTLVLATNFSFFLSFSLFFLLPRFVVTVGGSEDDIGYIFGVGGIASIVCIPITGVLVDRFGRKPFLFAGALAMALADLGFVFVDSAGIVLYAFRALQGGAFAVAFTAAGTLAADLLPPARRTWGLGLFGVATLVTHAIGPSIAEPITDRFGFIPVFILGTSLAALSALLATRIHDAPPPPKTASDPPAVSLLEVLMGSGIGTPLLLNFTCGAGFGSLITFLPTFTDAVGLSGVKSFFIAYSLVSVCVRIFGSSLPDRLGKQWFIFPAALVYALCVFATAEMDSRAFLIAEGLIFGLAHGYLYPVLNALVVDRVEGSNVTGKAMSLFVGSFNAGFTISIFGFGWVAEHLGYEPMFRLAGAITITGLFLYAAGELRRASRERSIPPCPARSSGG